MTTPYKCPHCGWTYDPSILGYGLVPQHAERPLPVADAVAWDGEAALPCQGSGQHPRNAETDHRRLWRDGGEA